MVYVDELRSYAQKATSGGRYFGSGKWSCHLTADTVDELHAFADRIGMRRAWFQNTRTPHYDLTPRKRAQALQAGAQVETTQQYIDRIRRSRAAADHEKE